MTKYKQMVSVGKINKVLGVNESKRGFTLVEIMIVIMIISITAVIGLGINFSSSQLAGRDGRRRTDVATYVKALELYANENGGKYPVSTTPSSLPGSCSSLGLTKYIPTCPKNPSGGASDYKYQTNPSSSDYCVWVNLDRTTNCYKACSNGSDMTYDYISGTTCTPASIP